MSTSEEPLANLLFEYPGADIILRSHDSHHFRVPKSHIVHSSPVLDELIKTTLDAPDDAHEVSLPVLQLPESGEILHNLLTFIFPGTPLVPPTTEKAMELLSVAQKYQMDSVMAYIRYNIAQQCPPPTERDTALRVYHLAQKHGLSHEAVHAARTISKYPINIEDLEDELDMMPGAFLYELWKYSEKVRAILESNLTDFRMTGARDTLMGLHCIMSSSSQITGWLDDYIESIVDAPIQFDLIEFSAALALHLQDDSRDDSCACGSMPTQTIRNFWKALASVVDASFREVSIIHIHKLLMRLKSLQAESALSLAKNWEDIQFEVDSTTSLPEPLSISDANLIIRSSDLVNFRVHKAVLAMASPFFEDLLSLPQPSDSESVDGLPVVQLTEDAELLHCLVSILYPVRSVIPDSYEKVLYLLAACQKYDMDQAQSYIRTEVNRWPRRFPPPFGNTAFYAYAIASEKGLIPEMESAARRTLDKPMTFKMIGEGLRLFQGSALRDLACFRKRCRDNIITCLKSFLQVDAPGPSSIWVGCPSASDPQSNKPVLPIWLRAVLSYEDSLESQVFTHPLPTSSGIRARYLAAIQTHDDCFFCLRVHGKKGSSFISQLEKMLKHAREKVHTSFL
jgi:BTB/POZ domain